VGETQARIAACRRSGQSGIDRGFCGHREVKGASRVIAWVQRPRERMRAYGLIALMLAILCVFPQPYVGRAKIVPQDPSSPLGSALGDAGSRLSDLSAVFGGGRRAIDLYLMIGQSANVRNDVIQNLKLIGKPHYDNVQDAQIRLARHVSVQSLPGGLLQIETKSFEKDEALELTSAFTDAIARRLRVLNAAQVGTKSKLLQGRFRQAATRLAQTQQELDAFRRRNRISAQPDIELGAAISLKAGLEAQLQGKLVEERTLSQILGPDNVQLRTTRASIAELRARLANSTAPATGSGGPNAGGLTEISSQYLNIYRDYIFAQSVYQAYARVSEQVTIDEVSGRSSPTVQVVEDPHIDEERHFNIAAVGSLALLLLLALFTEVYAPATGINLWRLRAVPVE
jgi:hypothetical protein